jgi:GST-like protein
MSTYLLDLTQEFELIFFLRNSERHEFGIERYKKETERLFGVLDKRLEGREWLAGDAYSIADIAAYGWAAPYNLFGLDLDAYPNVERWLEAIASRPATERAYAIAKDMNPNAPQPVRRAEREAAKQTVLTLPSVSAVPHQESRQ